MENLKKFQKTRDFGIQEESVFDVTSYFSAILFYVYQRTSRTFRKTVRPEQEKCDSPCDAPDPPWLFQGPEDAPFPSG